MLSNWNSGHKEGSNEQQMSLGCTESNDSQGNGILCLVWFGNELCDVVASKSHNVKKMKAIGSVNAVLMKFCHERTEGSRQDWCLVLMSAGCCRYCHWICFVLDIASAVPCADHAWRCGEGTDRSECACKPALVCHGNAPVVFRRLTMLKHSWIVIKTSGGDTCGYVE